MAIELLLNVHCVHIGKLMNMNPKCIDISKPEILETSDIYPNIVNTRNELQCDFPHGCRLRSMRYSNTFKPHSIPLILHNKTAAL